MRGTSIGFPCFRQHFPFPFSSLPHFLFRPHITLPPQISSWTRKKHTPSTAPPTAPAIERRHSRNLAWAARSCEKEFVRCSSSSSSCFFTWFSCWAEREARSTVSVSLVHIQKRKRTGYSAGIWRTFWRVVVGNGRGETK